MIKSAIDESKITFNVLDILSNSVRLVCIKMIIKLWNNNVKLVSIKNDDVINYEIINYGIVNYGIINYGIINYGIINYGIVNYRIINYGFILTPKQNAINR